MNKFFVAVLKFKNMPVTFSVKITAAVPCQVGIRLKVRRKRKVKKLKYNLKGIPISQFVVA